MYQSIQYSISGRTDRTITFKGEKWSVIQGKCRGVKKCFECGAVHSTKTKWAACGVKDCKGRPQRITCSVKLYYLKKDNARYVFLRGNHTHSDPPSRKISDDDIMLVEAFNPNPTLTKDVSKGIGVSFLPFFG